MFIKPITFSSLFCLAMAHSAAWASYTINYSVVGPTNYIVNRPSNFTDYVNLFVSANPEGSNHSEVQSLDIHPNMNYTFTITKGASDPVPTTLTFIANPAFVGQYGYGLKGNASGSQNYVTGSWYIGYPITPSWSDGFGPIYQGAVAQLVTVRSAYTVMDSYSVSVPLTYNAASGSYTGTWSPVITPHVVCNAAGYGFSSNPKGDSASAGVSYYVVLAGVSVQ